MDTLLEIISKKASICGLRQNTDTWSADPLLTPLKNHREKEIQSVVQIKLINIMLPEVPRMVGECCNGLTSIFFCYKYKFRKSVRDLELHCKKTSGLCIVQACRSPYICNLYLFLCCFPR